MADVGSTTSMINDNMNHMGTALLTDGRTSTSKPHAYFCLAHSV